MNRNKIKENIILQWIKIAERDLTAGEQGLKNDLVIT